MKRVRSDQEEEEEENDGGSKKIKTLQCIQKPDLENKNTNECTISQIIHVANPVTIVGRNSERPSFCTIESHSNHESGIGLSGISGLADRQICLESTKLRGENCSFIKIGGLFKNRILATKKHEPPNLVHSYSMDYFFVIMLDNICMIFTLFFFDHFFLVHTILAHLSGFDQYIFSLVCKQLKGAIKFDGSFYEIYDDFYCGKTISAEGYKSLFEWITTLNFNKSHIVFYNFSVFNHLQLLKNAVSYGYPIAEKSVSAKLFRKKDHETIKWFCDIGLKVSYLHHFVRYIKTDADHWLFKYIIQKSEYKHSTQMDILYELYKHGQKELIEWTEKQFGESLKDYSIFIDSPHFKLPPVINEDDNNIIDNINNDNNNNNDDDNDNDESKRLNLIKKFIKDGNLVMLKKMTGDNPNETKILPIDSAEMFIENYISYDEGSSNMGLESQDHAVFLDFLTLDIDVELENVIETALAEHITPALLWAIKEAYNNNNDRILYIGQAVQPNIQRIFNKSIHILSVDEIKFFIDKGCTLNHIDILEKYIYKIGRLEVFEYLYQNGIFPSQPRDADEKKGYTLLDHLLLAFDSINSINDNNVIDISKFWMDKFKSGISKHTFSLTTFTVKSCCGIFKRYNERLEFEEIFYQHVQHMPIDTKGIKHIIDGGFFSVFKNIVLQGDYKPESIAFSDNIDPTEFYSISEWVNHVNFLLSLNIPWDQENKNLYIWSYSIFQEYKKDKYLKFSFQHETHKKIFQLAVFLIEKGCPCPTVDLVRTMLKDLNDKNEIIYNETFWHH